MAGAGKPGQRGFVVRKDDQRLVRALASCGRSQDDIARRLGISDVTLRKFFRPELDNAEIDATSEVEQSVFQMATRGKNLAAAQFWLRNRARDRWSEGKIGDDSQGPAVNVTFQWADTPPAPEPLTIEGETG